jgi:hypothetical protein
LRVRLLKDERVRDGLVGALVAVALALVVRFLVTNPQDYLHYSVLKDLTGIDFGVWPDIFYTGGGGDGEVFAVLAADPVGQGASQLIPAVMYRFARIGLSWVAWVLSLGQEGFVLPALFVAGLIAAAGVGFISGFMRRRLGLRSWLLILNPALYLGFAGDTAEPLGILLLSLALGGSGLWAAAALGATRPTFGTALFGHWKLISAAVAVGIAIRLLAVWIFDGSLTESVGGAFALPFSAYFRNPSVTAFLVLAGAVLTLSIGFLRRDLAWIVSAALVLVLGEAVTANPANAVRAAGMLPVIWAFGPNWKPASRAFRGDDRSR